MADELNAALTFAATVLLTISPETIPGTVGFPTVRDTYPMGYMLGAANWGWPSCSSSAASSKTPTPCA